MSELINLGLREIASRSQQVEHDVFSLCREQNINPAIRDSSAGKILSGLQKIQAWSEAILKECK